MPFICDSFILLYFILLLFFLLVYTTNQLITLQIILRIHYAWIEERRRIANDLLVANRHVSPPAKPI